MLKIYNINNRDCKYGFMGWRFAKKYFNPFDYKVVYSDDRKCSKDDLESIFREFNRVTNEDCERLKKVGFKGHSLSTSDLVQTDDGLFYCDSCGWEKVGD